MISLLWCSGKIQNYKDIKKNSGSQALDMGKVNWLQRSCKNSVLMQIFTTLIALVIAGLCSFVKNYRTVLKKRWFYINYNLLSLTQIFNISLCMGVLYIFYGVFILKCFIFLYYLNIYIFELLKPKIMVNFIILFISINLMNCYINFIFKSF